MSDTTDGMEAHSGQCEDYFGEKAKKEIDKGKKRIVIFVCVRNNKGIYGVFSKRKYAEECKKDNKYAVIDIFERTLDIFIR